MVDRFEVGKTYVHTPTCEEVKCLYVDDTAALLQNVRNNGKYVVDIYEEYLSSYKLKQNIYTVYTLVFVKNGHESFRTADSIEYRNKALRDMYQCGYVHIATFENKYSTALVNK